MQKWSSETDLWLFTPEEFQYLPEGFELESISGERVIKGKDYIDDDTRFGHLAYGVRDPVNHCEGELLTRIKLTVAGK